MPRIKAGDLYLNYEISGEGDPLLLIMGFGMPGAAWVPNLPFLAGFRCIFFDNRGTGFSDKPDLPAYTVADMAEDASNLLKALKISKAKVFGVSMGGMIAQELVLRHPDLVERVVLGCTMPGGPKATMASEEVSAPLRKAFEMMEKDPEKTFEMIMPVLYPPQFIAAHPELKNLMVSSAKMMPPTAPETPQRAMLGIQQFDAYERLGQIKCPVLIVHGEKDVLVPAENAALIKSKIPHAELYMVPDAGHAFQAADPAKIHERIVSWLKK